MAFRRLDLWMAVLLALVSAAVAVSYLRAGGLGAFYQARFAPAVMMACTGKLANPAGISQERLAVLVDFLQERRKVFDCSLLAQQAVRAEPLNPFQTATIYLLWLSGLVWMLTQVAWANLVAVGAILSGLMTAAVYGVSRLYVRTPLSAAVAILATLSPSHLNMLGHLRDYSKAPFVVGLIFFSGLALLSSAERRKFLVASAAAGCISGVGLGFRSDLIVAPLFFALVLLICAIKGGIRTLPLLALGAALFGMSLIATATPALTAYAAAGGGIGHVALLGTMTPFNSPLGLMPTSYDLGHLYNDGYVRNLVQLYLYRSLSPPETVPFLGPEYNAASLRLLVQVALAFPADFLVRTYAAILSILDNRFTLLPMAAGFESLAEIRSYTYAPGRGIVAALLAVLIVGLRRPQASIFLVTAAAFFCGLTALQFSTRHFFYLELFFWLSAAILVSASIDAAVLAVKSAAARARRGRMDDESRAARTQAHGLIRPALLALTIPGTALAAGFATATGLRAYQQARATPLLERYLEARREPIELTAEVREDNVLFRPRGPIINVAGTPTPLDGLQPNAFYLVATIDPTRCEGSLVTMTVAYKTRPTFRSFSTLAGGGSPTHIFFPAWKFPGMEFEGVVLPLHQRSCLQELAAVADYRSLPFPLWLRLGPNWRKEHLYQVFDKPLVPWWRWGSALDLRTPPDLLEGAPLNGLEIRPLDESDWSVLAPQARVQGHGILLEGRTAPAAFSVLSKPLSLPKNALLALRGTVREGGATVGILNSQGAWGAAPITLPEGAFVVAIKIPEQGHYRFALAGSGAHDDIHLSEVGLVGLTPAAHGVPARSPESAE